MEENIQRVIQPTDECGMVTIEGAGIIRYKLTVCPVCGAVPEVEAKIKSKALIVKFTCPACGLSAPTQDVWNALEVDG